MSNSIFFVNLHRMEIPLNNNTTAWSENVILVDANYIDKVAFNLIVNFERILNRRIPKADLAKWIDCIALDGGIRPTKEQKGQQTQVIFIYRKEQNKLENFVPADCKTQLNGQAFNDNLGEFLLSAFPIEKVVSKTYFMVDILQNICKQSNVKRVMIIPDSEEADTLDEIRHILKYADNDKQITMFAMQPMIGGNFKQEILGYSLLNALGIKSEEIK